MNTTFLSSWVRKISRRPRRFFGILILLWLAWVAGQANTTLIDQPLSEADVSARRVQVNRSELDQLRERLETYHRPATPPVLTTNHFRLVEPTDASN